MVGFAIGLFFGASVGFFTGALLATASRAEDDVELEVIKGAAWREGYDAALRDQRQQQTSAINAALEEAKKFEQTLNRIGGTPS